jgi:hypothetical protein
MVKSARFHHSMIRNVNTLPSEALLEDLPARLYRITGAVAVHCIVRLAGKFHVNTGAAE